jgi:hypothetical protein
VSLDAAQSAAQHGADALLPSAEQFLAMGVLRGDEAGDLARELGRGDRVLHHESSATTFERKPTINCAADARPPV